MDSRCIAVLLLLAAAESTSASSTQSYISTSSSTDGFNLSTSPFKSNSSENSATSSILSTITSSPSLSSSISATTTSQTTILTTTTNASVVTDVITTIDDPSNVTSNSNTSSSDPAESTASTGAATTTTSIGAATTTEAITATVTASPNYNSTTPTPADVPLFGVMISETNILLTNSSTDIYFIELQTQPNTTIDEVWLVVRNADLTSNDLPLLVQKNSTSESTNRLLMVVINNGTEIWNELRRLESVLIALYADKHSAESLTTHGLYDFLLYSSNGSINSGLSEQFKHPNLIIDYKKLNGLHEVSLSRCYYQELANTAVILMNQSPNETNTCHLSMNKTLMMKLTSMNKQCSSSRLPDINSSLAIFLINGVNSREQCGLGLHMLSDMKVEKYCASSVDEIGVQFLVRSAFQDQLSLITSGYQTFLSTQSKFSGIPGEFFAMSACDQGCFPKEEPPTKPDDNRIRVTIAVVISCIGVFLIVVLFVYLYLRRKKKGIIQFSMSRLDEDDLIGDMDDFVGNQGPTFRSFK